MPRPQKADEEEIEIARMMEPPKPPYAAYELMQASKVTHFYISEDVKEPSKYVDMIYRIQSAGENDTVVIHLNTPGGRLDTGVQLINAMRSSEATIITSLESQAHSLGTLIFLCGDQFIVHDNCMMMFHNYSSGSIGKGNEQLAEVEATTRWFNQLMADICHPFLSNTEIDRIGRGEDLWLDSEQIRKRLAKMVKHLQKLQAEAEEALVKDALKDKEKKKAKAKKKTEKD